MGDVVLSKPRPPTAVAQGSGVETGKGQIVADHLHRVASRLDLAAGLLQLAAGDAVGDRDARDPDQQEKGNGHRQHQLHQAETVRARPDAESVFHESIPMRNVSVTARRSVSVAPYCPWPQVTLGAAVGVIPCHTTLIM